MKCQSLSFIVNADRKLYEAVDVGNLRRTAAWLERGANPNAQDPKTGWTSLFEAVAPFKDPALAELLLAKGADVRVRDNDGQTPLHHAVCFAEETHLRILLDHGKADINARDRAGQTPLHLAADRGRIETTTFLVSRGADVSLRDHEGRTPPHCLWENFAQGLMCEDVRQPLERLLSGFMTARIVAAPPDSLILRVETVHSKYPDVERQATERGTLTVPCGIFLPKTPRNGDLIRCERGLTPGLDEAWQEARRQLELGIERER